MRNTYAFLLTSLLALHASAQRGIPPKDIVTTNINTKYAQHIDFSPDMVKNLKVPDGWEIKIAVSGLGKPRMLYSGKNGNLYVTRRDGGDILLLSHANTDGTFEDITTIVSDFKGVHGITMKDNFLYACNNKEVRRFPMLADGSVDVDKKETVIKDLPGGGQHPNRTLDFGPDGMLYISVGSVCNDCKDSDKEVASMLVVDPKTWKRTIYSSGLRNTIGFDWNPQTRELWGVDNGCDYKGDKWPPEELNQLKQGADYGFPLAYGKREIDKTREDPQGDTKENAVKGTEPSAMDFAAHSAPIAFRFFESGTFKGDALVCWHGSWNTGAPVGYKVERIIFRNGQPASGEDFVSGFLINGGKELFGRPAGLAITNEGTVYISDDANGIIYSIKPKK
jgi:glucose/arabinose dehydrogenase